LLSEKLSISYHFQGARRVQGASKGLPGIEYLLAFWMDPLAGGAAYKMMDAALEYMQRIHVAIREIAAKSKKYYNHQRGRLTSIDYGRNTWPHRGFYDADKIIDRENLL
jgi:hypothetical protein